MANILYLRDGPPLGSLTDSIAVPLDEVAKHFGHKRVRFFKNYPVFNEQHFNPYIGPRYVVVFKEAGDPPRHPFDNGGYYLLEDTSPEEVTRTLARK